MPSQQFLAIMYQANNLMRAAHIDLVKSASGKQFMSRVGRKSVSNAGIVAQVCDKLMNSLRDVDGCAQLKPFVVIQRKRQHHSVRLGSEDDPSLLLWMLVEDCLVVACDVDQVPSLRDSILVSVDQLIDILRITPGNRVRVMALLNHVSLAFEGSYDVGRGSLFRMTPCAAITVPAFVIGMVMKSDFAKQLIRSHEQSMASRHKTANPNRTQFKRSVHLDTTETVPLLSAIASVNLPAEELNWFAREVRRVWSSATSIAQFQLAFLGYAGETFDVPLMIRDLFNTEEYFRSAGCALQTHVMKLTCERVVYDVDADDVVDDDEFVVDDDNPTRQSVHHGEMCAGLVRVARTVLADAAVKTELEHEWATRLRLVLQALDANLPWSQLPAIVRRIVNILLNETIVPLGGADYCLLKNQTQQECYQTVAAVALTVIAHCDVKAIFKKGYMPLTKHLRKVLARVWQSTNQASMASVNRFMPGFVKLYSFAAPKPVTKERQLRQFRPIDWAPGQKY
jgi:hypothetical protein